MDTQLSNTELHYRSIIKKILQEYATDRNSWSDSCKSQFIFDDDRGHYLVLEYGWDGDRYFHATPIHLEIIERTIWIQYDDTEEGIATDLLEAGIPKENIILGFRHPRVRQHTGFAIA